jgi:glycogen operon protein
VDGRRADGSYGVLWLRPDAHDMEEEDWNFPNSRFLSYVIGPQVDGQSPLYIVLNAATEEIELRLPALPEYSRWRCLLDTTDGQLTEQEFASGTNLHSPARAVLAFEGLL